MKLLLSFSPCPNDTFIFDALIHQKIDTEGLEFDVRYEDVETLNHSVFKQIPDISKLSFHAFAYSTEHYALLRAGSALGFGVGPLLISRDTQISEIIRSPDAQRLRVGIPGKYTTANFLLSLFYPEINRKKLMKFSEIEDRLLDGEIDLGLIIHENRFTFLEKGLNKLVDLGESWEKETSMPIPLGGIVVKKSLPLQVQSKINRVLRRSVEFAFKNPKSGLQFIRSHAQTMHEDVMYKHIDLYVNDFTLDLGHMGVKAIELMFSKARQVGAIPDIHYPIMVPLH